MTPRRVLVTGASGFVGEALLHPLAARGFEVHAVGRRPPRGPVAAFHALDLRDTAALPALLHAVRPSHLLHAAWQVEPGRFWTAKANRDWVGITAALARAAVQAGVQRLLGVGSCAEYDWRDGGARPRRETDPTDPDTLYGACKLAALHEVRSACHGSATGWAWARLFHLVGQHQPDGRLVPQLLQALRAGREAPTGPRHHRRDYLDAEDAGAALAALMDSDLQGPVNVARGETATVEQIGLALAELTGRPDLLRLDQLPGRPSDAPVMAADTARLQAATGFVPRLTLFDSLRRCAGAATEMRRGA